MRREELLERIAKCKVLLEAERKEQRYPVRSRPAPVQPAASPEQVELQWDRDSVCMGDDAESHRRTVLVDGHMRLSALLHELADYVPAMAGDVVWSVRTREEQIGYILGGGRDAPVVLEGEDREVRSLRARRIDCGYYHPGRFSWIEGKDGKRVESYRECPTVQEKVRKKEAYWRESCAVMDDFNSRDPRRIWSAAGDIVRHGQDPDWIRHFFYRMEDIERAARGVELGGGIAPNRRFVDYALETIRFHKEGRGCPCGLYPMTGDDCVFDPEKEAEAGWVRILDTVYERGSRFVDHYVIQCTRCGQIYRVAETVGHWTSWKWVKLGGE